MSIGINYTNGVFVRNCRSADRNEKFRRFSGCNSEFDHSRYILRLCAVTRKTLSEILNLPNGVNSGSATFRLPISEPPARDVCLCIWIVRLRTRRVVCQPQLWNFCPFGTRPTLQRRRLVAPSPTSARFNAQPVRGNPAGDPAFSHVS
jgi:hypothetical protein